MQLLTISQFIGHFHPVLVHLPIGILILAGLFHLLSTTKTYAFLIPVVRITYLLGAITAVASCITGYLLSQTSDYDIQLVTLHQWLGIGVAVVATLLYLLLKYQKDSWLLRLLTVAVLIGIIITGHYGGSLTHGSGYLLAGLQGKPNNKMAIPPVTNVQQAKVYSQLVQPLLKNRCYSCHGAEKQKGKLRLDSKISMVKGGEGGAALVVGKAAESELVKRLLLPLDNEDHMPPKEKPQLRQEEIALLKWWIDQGADIHKTVAELIPNPEISAALPVFQVGSEQTQKAGNDWLKQEVAAADATALKKLKDAGVIVLPVQQNSHYISVSFITAQITPDLLEELKKLEKQLVYLELAYTALNDDGMKALSALKNLIQLNVRGTAITDQGLVHLKGLQQLTTLNLVETKVTDKGVSQLKALKKLNSIYLFQTSVDKQQLASLKAQLPGVTLDMGGYQVPTLATDTTVVR